MVSQVQKKMVSFLLENEKMMNRLYQLHQEGELSEADIPENIKGVGLYNFYKEPLFLIGSAGKVLEHKGEDKPYFDEERETIILNRDLLNPFLPMLGNDQLIEKIHEEMTDRASAASANVKKKMVRYIYVEIADTPIKYFILRYRIIFVLIILMILALILYIGHLSFRNLRYREKIESQERLVLLGTAARTLTHDVKNPLSSIRLQTSIIARSGCSHHTTSLEIINEEVNRLASMTERIGDFLRHPVGNPCRTDLRGEIERILQRRGEQSILSDRTEKTASFVWIDPERLSSVIDNLLNNAGESGSDPDKIRLTLEQKGQDALISVKDEGTGIPPENLEHIFDPFFTTKSKGSGVGLSIIYSFIQAVDGSVRIESEPESGTEVIVSLPLLKDS